MCQRRSNPSGSGGTWLHMNSSPSVRSVVRRRQGNKKDKSERDGQTVPYIRLWTRAPFRVLNPSFSITGRAVHRPTPSAFFATDFTSRTSAALAAPLVAATITLRTFHCTHDNLLLMSAKYLQRTLRPTLWQSPKRSSVLSVIADGVPCQSLFIFVLCPKRKDFF